MEQERQQKPLGLADMVDHILYGDIGGLERRLALHTGAAHCVAVSDGATGLAMALLAIGAQPGDRILCAAMGCALPVEGIALAGCQPVFVDVNPNTYTIDPCCVEYSLRKLRRMGENVPKVLIATDLFGAPCNYPALQALCDREGMALIEDLSGAFGAGMAGCRTGSFGRFAVASFGTSFLQEEPGGGAVFCRDERDALRLENLRKIGLQDTMGEPHACLPRMTCTDAALVRAGLEEFEGRLARRRAVAEAYRKHLEARVRLQQIVARGESAYSQMVVALPKTAPRKRVIELLRGQDIPCGAPACGIQTVHSDWNWVMLINTMAVAERLLALPIHEHMRERTVEYICRCLLQALDAKEDPLVMGL